MSPNLTTDIVEAQGCLGNLGRHLTKAYIIAEAAEAHLTVFEGTEISRDEMRELFGAIQDAVMAAREDLAEADRHLAARQPAPSTHAEGGAS